MAAYYIIGISLTLATFSLCMCSFHAILRRLLAGGSKVPRRSAYLIANHAVSSCHATLAFTAGVAIVCGTADDIMAARSSLCDYYPWCAVGYGIYDLVSIYWTHSVRQGEPTAFSLRRLCAVCAARPMIIVHHVGLFLLALPVVLFLRNGKGDFFVGCFMFFECSTPCTLLRAVLAEMDMKSGRLYAINGVAMLASWFASRILTVPFMFVRYSQYSGVPLLRLFVTLPYTCLLGTGSLLALQMYWFALMLAGARRLLLGRTRCHKTA